MIARIEKAIDAVVKPVEPPPDLKPGERYATHAGILKLGPFEVRVYVLDNGKRIIHDDDMMRLLSGRTDL